MVWTNIYILCYAYFKIFNTLKYWKYLMIQDCKYWFWKNYCKRGVFWYPWHVKEALSAKIWESLYLEKYLVTSIQRWTKVNVQGLPLFLHKHAMIYNLRATSIKRENNAKATMPSQRLFWLARRLTIKILQKQKYQVHHTYKISPASFQCCQLWLHAFWMYVRAVAFF